ncbi:recombinase family protein [Chryseobacterium sp. G0162]|uniref:recombinase family protein n=1 Tax=Chryseobacterium sp. G0162 TaxID=2487063 RepID=UPI000F4E8BF2|nr:recombinase family protein [Chryseobacterium sp. G0162]AZB09303.1 recombinase family protein [Chryseobacterium sp. G0162]
MTVGYARVSTPEQNISTQVEMLKDNGCEKIFTDIASGVREDRLGLNEMLSYLRKDDIILVYKTDRIFRSLKNMIELIDKFNEKGILFKSITEPAFDTTSANGKFIIQIFGAVAEFERSLISERTKSGLEGARKRKKLLGRPKGSSQKSIEKYQYAKHLYDNKNIPINKACQQAAISKATFYRIDKIKTT